MTTQTQQEPEVTFKISFIQEIIKELEEVPHKWSRTVIDKLIKNTNDQLQAVQSSTTETPEATPTV